MEEVRKGGREGGRKEGRKREGVREGGRERERASERELAYSCVHQVIDCIQFSTVCNMKDYTQAIDALAHISARQYSGRELCSACCMYRELNDLLIRSVQTANKSTESSSPRWSPSWQRS